MTQKTEIYPAPDVLQNHTDNVANELIRRYSSAEHRLELIESGNARLQAAFGAWRKDVADRAEQIKQAIADQVRCDIEAGKINGEGGWPKAPGSA